ncbi:MAG TPA: hypothetical protein VEF04_09975 [Blastocatellia bacterium]|nr:hypothetical protein [Blastocatellia bacterium]
MKRTILLTIAMLCLFVPSGYAQKKRTPTRRTTPAPKTQPVVDTKQEAMMVADQIKILSRFVYTYGKVINGIEVSEDQAKRTRLSPELIEKNRQIKSGVVNGIAGLKGGIDKLDEAFKKNPKLQIQYINLTGVSEAILRARDLAANNQFDEAGRSLLTSIERLTSILLDIK